MPYTYTEREVAQIIERAVVRQEEARRRENVAGLTMDDLVELGREVGVDPEFLREAAAEVDAGAAERSRRTTTTHIHTERWTAGPLDEHDWEDAVERLREALGTDYGQMYGRTDSGKSVETGATRVWEHTSGLGVHTRIAVSERGERTRIRAAQQVGLASSPVEGAMYGLLSMLLLGPLAAGLGTGLIGDAAGLAVSVVLGLVFLAAASYGTYRADVAWRKKKHRQLDELVDRLAMDLAPSGAATAQAATAQAAALPAAPNAPPTPVGRVLDAVPPMRTPAANAPPRLSLDELPDAAPEGRGTRRGTRGRA